MQTLGRDADKVRGDDLRACQTKKPTDTLRKHKLSQSASATQEDYVVVELDASENVPLPHVVEVSRGDVPSQ
eukprot:scaffold67931_cov32-Tisochrysis_lutea.AAC.1